MLFGFLVNMENTISIYFYSTPWALFPQKWCVALEFLVLISSHCSTQIWRMRNGGSWSIYFLHGSKKIHALRKYEPCVLREKKYQGTLHFLKTNIFFLLKKNIFWFPTVELKREGADFPRFELRIRTRFDWSIEPEKSNQSIVLFKISTNPEMNLFSACKTEQRIN